MNRLLAILIVSTVVSLSTMARADTFTLVATNDISDLIVTLNVQATQDASLANAWDVTSITGWESGSADSLITGIAGNQTYQPSTDITATATFQYDNILYTSGPFVDSFGLLYTIDLRNTGITEVRNLTFATIYDFNRDSHLPQEQFTSVTLTDTTGSPLAPAVVPEPCTLGLLVTGLFSTAALARRSKASKMA